MAHFYGTLEGGRGQTTRCGTKNSGVTVVGASWNGAVRTSLWFDEENDTDMVEVSLVPWQGVGSSRILYHGPVSGE